MATWTDLGIDLHHGATGNVKTFCPKCSADRKHYRDKCLSVHVEDGVFKCHNCGHRGSLNAGAFGAGWGRQSVPKVYRTPEPLPDADLSPKAAAWFAERGIGPEALRRRKITGDDGAIKFPYVRNGELVNVKTRFRGKRFAMEADCELILWGLDECANAEQVVIVEGEMDALAVETAGIPFVLSVPNGAQTGAMEFLASGEALFARCHTIILAVDADAPGLALEAELSRRIGKEKCYRVRWPDGCKDANDVLLAHGAAAVCRCIAEAEPFPIEGITTAHESEEDIVTLYELGRQHGLSTGWASLDNLYTIKPGQMSVVTGIPGSGKSEWLDALIVNLARREGWSFGLFSPENHPVALHAAKFAEKVIGKPFFQGRTERMTKEELHRFIEWATDFLYFIVPPEPTLDDVLDRARALVFRSGIRGLVIDPWNELDHTRPKELTETEHVSRCLTKIRQFARTNDLHAWVVAHPRIMRRESGKVPVPTPYDISGSAHWFNKADNCITVWRDKEDDAAPVEVHTQKIRFREVGRLGIAYLNYDRVTGNYRDAHRWEAAGGAK